MAKILLVDDEPCLLSLYSTVLIEAGHNVETVSSGLEAIERIAKGAPDLILMDIEMPEMGGLEAAKKMRKIYGQDLSICALTSHELLPEIRMGLDAGFDGYIVKPVYPAELLSEISLLFFDE